MDTFKTQLAGASNLDEKTVDKLLDAFSKILAENAETLTTVSIPSFGSFVPVKYDEEERIDLSTGKKMLYPPHIEIEFKPAASFRKKSVETNE